MIRLLSCLTFARSENQETIRLVTSSVTRLLQGAMIDSSLDRIRLDDVKVLMACAPAESRALDCHRGDQFVLASPLSSWDCLEMCLAALAIA